MPPQEQATKSNAQSNQIVLELTADGGYALCGTLAPTNWGLVRLNSSGDTLWTRNYSVGWGGAKDLKQTSDGGFILVGRVSGQHLALLKTDSLGNQQNQTGISGPDMSGDFSMTFSISGNLNNRDTACARARTARYSSTCTRTTGRTACLTCAASSLSRSGTNATACCSRDAIDSGSSRGPGGFGDNLKPDIAAPGVAVCSSVPGNNYTCGYSGTSMASPHSAGAVALLWSAMPQLVGKITDTVNLLHDSANPTVPPAPASCGGDNPNVVPNNTYGYGYLDALNLFLLEQHADGRTVVLVIDEAQNLAPDVLEQVRMISNLETVHNKLIQIILAGQPELNDVLGRHDLRQLSQRITVRCHLTPMDMRDTAEYIRHRLKVSGCRIPGLFSSGAVKRIYRFSRGVPRLINIVCEQALVMTWTQESSSVTPAIAARVIEGAGHSPGRRSFWQRIHRWLWAGR